MNLSSIKEYCPNLYRLGQIHSITDCMDLYKLIVKFDRFSIYGKMYSKRKLRNEINKLISLLSIEKFK